MSKDYENDLLNEFANSTGQEKGEIENVYAKNDTKKEPVKDLGKVEIRNPNAIPKQELENDPAIQKMQSLVNYVPLTMEDLPTQGRFYADNVRIYIRAARVGEVREYSMMDETNPNDVIEKTDIADYVLKTLPRL